jgi:enoyl-[acyl-carrier protein] reductase / trans-2-enoyl-CoA reductase (NAD+)
MPEQVITPRIRGFLCLTAHPEGCAANVRKQIEYIRGQCPGQGLGRVLVIGASTGFGLSSLLTSLFGYGADAVAIGLEREPSERKPGSAGWYNLTEAKAQAQAAGRQLQVLNGDAFSQELKDQTIATLKQDFGPVDLVIYSLAAPRRKAGETTYSSVLKPIGKGFTGKTIDLDKDTVTEAGFEPASDEEIAATIKVMGGDDWEVWIEALRAHDLLAAGCRTVAYSYIGPAVTEAIYRSGTIGKAKEHLEATAQELDAILHAHCGGHAWVSVNKALVTQASAAIPVVSLYVSILFKVMKEAGVHEDCMEQIARLFTDHIGPGLTPKLDPQGRIRMDDKEMAPTIQKRVAELWDQVASDNLMELTDYTGFKRAFRQLFGFEVPGIDYQQPTEIIRSW